MESVPINVACKAMKVVYTMDPPAGAVLLPSESSSFSCNSPVADGDEGSNWTFAGSAAVVKLSNTNPAIPAVDRKLCKLVTRDDDDDDNDDSIEKKHPSVKNDREETSCIAIGCKIRKQSGKSWYVGQVTTVTYSSNGRDPCYRVQYEDGDEEDLGLKDVLAVMATYQKHANSPSSTAKTNNHDPDKAASATETAATRVLRRSSRESKPTLIYVDGQAVKKENNYVLKGLSYHHGVLQGDAAKPKRPLRNKKPPAAKKQPAAYRKEASSSDPRIKQKELLAQNVADKKKRRQACLLKHLDVLEPFLDSKVQTLINSFSGSAAAAVLSPSTEQHMQPDSITADLRDYQLLGLNWMSQMYQNNLGMILGDEMGLGKTIQTLSLICHLKDTNKRDLKCPDLVVCPMSVLYSWCDEITKWAPSLKYLRFHASNAECLDTSILHTYDVIVTTYEMIKAPALKNAWARQAFQLVVLDEGHCIKNVETLISKAVRRLHSETRIILTGTPVANNLVELWSLLNFLAPDVFTTPEPFSRAFNLTLNVVDAEKLKQAHKALNVFMLRRLKTEVEKLMPKKIETKIVCPLSNTQIWWYKAILLKDINLLARGDTGGVNKAKHLCNLVMQLRKCCIHPFLFPGAEDPDTNDLESLVGASGKLTVLDKLLCSLYRKGHRVVLFSQFTSVLDILDDYANMRGWNYIRFDGGTARAKRNFLVKSFNEPGSDKFLFLMSTRSGGMGLNLQTADTCILMDSDWNPQPDIQAMARVHRIGQKKTVHVYRLVTQGTVEARMVERAEKKLYLDRMVTRDDTSKEMIAEEDSDKLMATLKFGCNAVFGQDSDRATLPTDADIEIITDRCRTEEYTEGKLRGGIDKTADNFNSTQEFTSTTEFGGIDFKKIRDQYQKQKSNNMGNIKEMWNKRQRKNRIKMVAGLGSGYGSAFVPVLASNDYDLAAGERSVFQQELKGRDAPQACKKKKKGRS